MGGQTLSEDGFMSSVRGVSSVNSERQGDCHPEDRFIRDCIRRLGVAGRQERRLVVALCQSLFDLAQGLPSAEDRIGAEALLADAGLGHSARARLLAQRLCERPSTVRRAGSQAGAAAPERDLCAATARAA